MPISPEKFEDVSKKGVPASEEKEELKELTFEQVVTPEHLQMISKASGGFRFAADPKMAQEFLETGALKTGYTNKETKVIYYNPLLLKGVPELKIPSWRAVDIKGFTYHEAGHHAPEVEELEEKLLEDLKNPEIIPEAYKGSPAAEARFLQAIFSNLDNALLDMWLESSMGKRPYYLVRESITEFQKGKGDIESYKGMSKPEQFLQALLRSRYFEPKEMEKRLDPEVHEAYKRVMESGAMQVLLDRRDFENYFAAPRDEERAIERKFAAYKGAFLPEYLNLLEQELEERKKERQQQKKGEPQEGEEPGKPQKGGGAGPSGAAPLTKEEEQELIEEILKGLEESGKEHSMAPDPAEEEQKQKVFSEIKQRLEEREKRRREGKPEEEEQEAEKPPEKLRGEEAIRQLAKELERESKEKEARGLAAAMQVRQESVQRWERIKERYNLEITSLASSLAEVFLDDRRKRLEYLKREGEIVPGLEYETIAALISGELDPETRMKTVRNPEFLETELEFIVDTSGSMMGEKLEKSVDTLVIVTEALKRVKEDLAGENLLMENEEPFRVGVTKFSDVPERVTKLTDPLDDKKELQIIDKASQVGGGTEESAALKEVYRELTLGKKNILKIMAILTDGYGNREGVAPIIRQIEEDKEVIFLALGLGSSKDEGEAIVTTYLEPLRGREGNVFGHAAANPNEVLPAVLEFLKREVDKKRAT